MKKSLPCAPLSPIFAKTMISRILPLVAIIALLPSIPARAASAADIRAASAAALEQLYANNPIASGLGKEALAVLVFPKIVKGGFVVAGQFGEGALFENGVATGYYSSAAASIGYQAGLQKFGYALFFMNEKALSYLKKSKGWSLGAGPELVVVNKGFSKDFSTTSARKDIYAIAFDQKGLMAGVGIQGSKITRIHPD
jgi:lipid-binding SYLF domain-containing protein